MKKRKQRTDKRLLKIFGVVCLSFLMGVLGGAVMANMLGSGEQAELSEFLQTALEETGEASFLSIFLKYMKYDLLIWLGGWMPLGLFVSGAAFLLRSVSVGFTAAMLMTTYGAKGVLITVSSFLPQNLLLIPTYLFIMSAAVYYLFSWQEQGGKRGLRRERRRKQTEYCILFLASVMLLVVAAGIERMLLLV